MRAERAVRSVTAVVAAIGLAVAGSTQARAQGSGFDAGVGISVPMAELADTWQVGPSFGLGLAAAVSDQVRLRVDGDMARNAGSTFANGRSAPDLTGFRYTGGVELRFTRERVPDWYTVVGVGAGGVSFSTDRFPLPDDETGDFDASYFTAYGALRVGYRVSSHVGFSLRSRLYLNAMDEADSQVFAVLSDGEVDGFGTEWTFPLQLRTEITF